MKLVPRMITIAQRYLVPRLVISLYYSIRFGCMVSTLAKVQLTSRIRLGRGCVVKPFAVIQTSGGRITFGRNCIVNNFAQIGTGTADVTFGNDVRMGPHVAVNGARRNYQRRDVRICDQGYSDPGVTIGDDVHLGTGTVIFGVNIGTGAVVGSGAVVTKDVEPYAVVAGVPAKVIGERT